MEGLGRFKFIIEIYLPFSLKWRQMIVAPTKLSTYFSSLKQRERSNELTFISSELLRSIYKRLEGWKKTDPMDWLPAKRGKCPIIRDWPPCRAFVDERAKLSKRTKIDRVGINSGVFEDAITKSPVAAEVVLKTTLLPSNPKRLDKVDPSRTPYSSERPRIHIIRLYP